MLVENGAMDTQAAETISDQRNGHALRTQTPASVYGARQVARIASILGEVDDTVQQRVGCLELGKRSYQSGIRCSYPPLVVGYGNLAAVVFGGSDGN